jgi:hypothetical protein
MDRRDLLRQFSLFTLAGMASRLSLPGAYAADCVTTPHLNGLIPPDANPTISATGQFHHFHYLHIPQVILLDPPEKGWSTISSLMRPELGIDDFFFQRREVRKQFHCHQVFISKAEIEAIANGQETTITAYINSGGRARPNHDFVFNRGGIDAHVSFQNEFERIQKIAKDKKLRTVAAKCDTRAHRGVTVFNAKETLLVTSLRELESLKGY